MTLVKQFIFACLILLNLQLTFAQSEQTLKAELKSRIELIDQLINDGEIMKAIEKSKETKTFIYKNFKNSNRIKEAILIRLDFCYYSIDDYENERAINIERANIREDDLKQEQNSFRKTFNSLSQNYLNFENTEDIVTNFKNSNKTLIDLTQEVFKKRFEVEREKFLKNNILPFYNLFQSYAYDIDYNNPSLNNLITNNALFFKGSLLNSSKDIIKNLRKLNDGEINKKIKEYRTVKSFITSQLSLNKKDRSKNFDVMRGRLFSLESELVIYNKRHYPNNLPLKRNWKKIQINENEVSIEFVRFKYFNKKWTDSIFYVAHILKKNSVSPKVIFLFEEKQIESIIENTYLGKSNNSRGSNGRTLNKITNKELYNLIIKPLEEDLKDVSKVYFSPDGLLHKIAFATLTDPNGNLLIKKYQLEQVNSSTVIKKYSKEPKSKTALFVGGINYNYATEGKTINKNIEKIPSRNNISQKVDKSWSYLKGTKEEVENLKKLFDTYEKVSSILSEEDAHEKSIKSISGNSPNILHLSTHGFFYENSSTNKSSDKNKFKSADNPLLRSGLLLAGANYAWYYGINPYEDEDGILTALEISNLDLSKTDLVVLSACETGLGDIEGSEGVYGLQRAFKMAGVDMLMMSLWEVPDKETAEFMTSFYKNWLSGQKIREAFRNTQLQMSDKYGENPKKWAAFVLIE